MESSIAFTFRNPALASILLLLLAPSALAQPQIDTEQLARFPERISESSGLARHGDSLWTLNDSGNAAELYELDSAGQFIRAVALSGVENVDWESMAHDEEFLYVADTGNNVNSRDEFPIYRIAWADLERGQARPELILFRYGDYQPGSRLSHNFDAEGLAVRGSELWLFSKNRGDRQTNLYRFPKLPGSYAPVKTQSLPIDSLATAADINPETGELALLANGRSLLGRRETLWLIPTSDTGVLWEQRRAVVIKPQDQWEAVLWRAEANELLLSHESTSRDYAGLASIPLSAFAD